MKKFKEFLGTHGILSFILGCVVFIVNLMISSEVDPMMKDFTIWDLVAFLSGIGLYYLLWLLFHIISKKDKEKTIAFLEEYLPLSGKKLLENKNLIRYGWHFDTKPYKINNIASILHRQDDNRELRRFTFYFNTVENGSIGLYYNERKIKASDSMQIVIEKMPVKEIFGKLDADLLKFFEMGDLHELAREEDTQRTIEKNAKKAMDLLGI